MKEGRNEEKSIIFFSAYQSVFFFLLLSVNLLYPFSPKKAAHFLINKKFLPLST